MVGVFLTLVLSADVGLSGLPTPRAAVRQERPLQQERPLLHTRIRARSGCSSSSCGGSSSSGSSSSAAAPLTLRGGSSNDTLSMTRRSRPELPLQIASAALVVSLALVVFEPAPQVLQLGDVSLLVG